MLKILNAKYPYFFIDEFQDTDDVQNVYHNWDMPEEEDED